jgi:hypothetical protein
MTELSEAAQAICARHFNWKSIGSCRKCPLDPECHNPPYHCTQKDLDEWATRINELAERLNRPALPHGPTERAAAQQELPI